MPAHWGALHLEQDLAGPPGVAAAGYSCFALAMTIGLGGGTTLLERLGRTRTLVGGGATAATGMLLGALAPSVRAALLGFAITGLGLANIFPVAVERAGSFAGPSGVAIASTLGYGGMLLGPPAIGFMADWFSLPVALTSDGAGGAGRAHRVRDPPGGRGLTVRRPWVLSGAPADRGGRAPPHSGPRSRAGTTQGHRPLILCVATEGQCPRVSPEPMGTIVRLKPHGAFRREATALRRPRQYGPGWSPPSSRASPSTTGHTRHMEIPEFVETLDQEGRSLAAAAEQAGPDAKVATCPGWQVRDLVRHTGMVHRWATAFVAEGYARWITRTAALAELDGAELLAWFRDGHRRLVDTLAAAAPPDLSCWKFCPRPRRSPSGHGGRRTRRPSTGSTRSRRSARRRTR